MSKSAKAKASKANAVEEEVCAICKKNAVKYHCPADRVGYCSVPCFKVHKAVSCFGTHSAPAASNATTLQALRDTPLAASHASQAGTDKRRNEGPLRSLDSLMWPPDPLEEGLNALSDPLNRDAPKPLLHSELLTIATSVPLRQMLAKHPFLKSMLSDIARIPNAPPKHPQAKRVRDMLGLGEDEGIPDQFNYRPKEEAQAIKDASARPQRTNARIGQEESAALGQFNELVKSILREKRQKNPTAWTK